MQEEFTDTLQRLPFWEDFSQTGRRIDSLKWKLTSGVKVTNTHGINAPSIYQLVFDGVDGQGNAYVQDSFFNGAGDSIISQSIDLSRVPSSRRSTVYMSFFYQLKGLGEIPEETDSLQLQFYSRDEEWISIDLNPENLDALALRGGLDDLRFDEDSVQLFNYITVPVTDPVFFHQDFRFKFVSYSSLAGVYDTWIIDYIYINQDRTASENEFNDLTISSSASALFYPYRSIPAGRFRRNPGQFSRPQTVELSCLKNDIFTIEFNHTIQNLNTTQLVSSGPKNDDGDIGFLGIEFGREVEGIAPQNLPLDGDSVVIQTEFIYNTGDTLLSEDNSTGFINFYPSIDLRVNDTLRENYVLKDYYAYDDGTAEFAAGINLLNGKLAVQYVLDELDTLTAIDVYFPNISPSNIGESIDLTIWNRLFDGESEELVARKIPYTITAQDINTYERIELVSPIFVVDTFYVGYTQFTDNFIGLGFDKNSPGGSDKIFFNTSREWVRNERITGSLMIRPVFKQGAEVTLDISNHQDQDVSIYPNPASDGIINISGTFDAVQLYDVTGRHIQADSMDSGQLDVQHLRSGFYFLKFQKGPQTITKKLIIK